MGEGFAASRLRAPSEFWSAWVRFWRGPDLASIGDFSDQPLVGVVLLKAWF